MMNHHYVNPAHSDAQVAIAEKTYQHSDLLLLLLLISFCLISSQFTYNRGWNYNQFSTTYTDLSVLFLVRVKPGMHSTFQKPNLTSHPFFILVTFLLEMMNHHYVNPAHSDAQVALAEKTYQHSDLPLFPSLISFCFISSQNNYNSDGMSINFAHNWFACSHWSTRPVS